MPRRRCVGSTPTTVSPAARTVPPPGTVSSKGNEVQPPTIAPFSRAPKTREGSTSRRPVLMESPLDERYDAVVVGARCAGAATAMLLARQGMKVLLFDRDRRGADTLSTLALMRAGVLQLHRWGLLGQVRAAGAPAI